MTASVDRDQLAVLRLLRDHFGAGQVEVLAVLDPGDVAHLTGTGQQQPAGIAPAPVAASTQASLLEEPCTAPR
jgi:hypothetical protein